MSHRRKRVSFRNEAPSDFAVDAVRTKMGQALDAVRGKLGQVLSALDRRQKAGGIATIGID